MLTLCGQQQTSNVESERERESYHIRKITSLCNFGSGAIYGNYPINSRHTHAHLVLIYQLKSKSDINIKVLK